MNSFSFDKAKEIAAERAKSCGKIIVKIEENDKYWRFEAGFEDGSRAFDDGMGSVYISKKDGTVRNLELWDMDFTEEFYSNAKLIYSFFGN